MIILKTGFYALIMTVMGATALAADTKFPEEGVIDTAVNIILKEQGGVGTAVVVIKNGVPLFMKGYGWANLEHMVPVTPDTVFQSGSIAKMFTATGIMMLIRDGKLSLDDKLAKFFPKGPKYWQRVTIRHLLSHRGGIRDVLAPGGALEIDTSKGDNKALEQYESRLVQEYTEEEYATLIGVGDKSFEPGTDFKYSNEAFVLLGVIIHKLSGHYYGDFLADKIFDKIGMRTTQINRNSQIIPNRSQSYEKKNEELTHAAYVSQFLNSTGDGSMLFTLKDLMQWDIALNKAEILPESYLEQMYQSYPYPDGSMGTKNYGFGWWSNSVRGHRLDMHGGSWQGFRTCFSRYRDDGLTVAVLSNAITVDSCLISQAVAGLYNPEYAPYKALADQSMTGKMKKITLDYLQGKIDRSLFKELADHDISEVQFNRMAKQVKFSNEDVFELVAKYAAEKNMAYSFRIKNKKEGQSNLVTYEIDQTDKIVKINFQDLWSP